MVFEEIFDRVDDRRLRLVFYNVEDPEACEQIIDYVGAQDVAIEYATDQTVAASTVVVRSGAETLSVDDIDAVATYIDSWEPTMGGDAEPPGLFAALDETVFRSSDRRQLLLAARLIETRAARADHGKLSVGFQQLSLARPQLSFYMRLPDEVTVSLYGEPDWVPPADARVKAYSPAVDAHADYRWVMFDGAEQRSQHAALLAEEQSPGEYIGFWTYRPSIIAELREVVDGLKRRRLSE